MDNMIGSIINTYTQREVEGEKLIVVISGLCDYR